MNILSLYDLSSFDSFLFEVQRKIEIVVVENYCSVKCLVFFAIFCRFFLCNNSIKTNFKNDLPMHKGYMICYQIPLITIFTLKIYFLSHRTLKAFLFINISFDIFMFKQNC